MKVIYNDWGIANNYGDCIEINRNLLKYPELYKFVMEHETKHTEDKSFNLNDLMVDIKDTFKVTQLKKIINLWFFMFRYPKSFVQLSPIWFKKGKIVLDLNLIIIYVIFVMLFVSLKLMWGITYGT